MTFKYAGPTLTEALSAAGFTHHKLETGNGYRHAIIDRSGCVVFNGTAYEVWSWLKRVTS